MTVADVVTPGSMQSKVNDYFNKNAFNCPLPLVANNGGDATATAYGDLPPGAVDGPGENNWDIAVTKTTKLTEAVTMQFRAETYNTFNHPQFSDPVTGNGSSGFFANVNTATFGRITTTAVNPRLIQCALRFIF